MYWIIIVIVFAVMAMRETRKERKHPGYRSWMSDDSNHKDQWWWCNLSWIISNMKTKEDFLLDFRAAIKRNQVVIMTEIKWLCNIYL